MEYESETAIHFIVLAVIFGIAFMFAAWRIVREVEKDDDDKS